MASWIKWAKGLTRRPEVLQIASRLGRSPREVAAILMELWEWADDNVAPDNESAKSPGFVRIVSGNCPPIDGILSVDGLTKCLVDVGWLIVHEDRIEFPKFGRHNGKSAKQRALDAERVAERRARSPQNVRVLSGLEPDGITTRGEEIRGDLNNPSISPQGESPSTPKQEPSKPKPDPDPEVPIPAEIDTPAFRDAWERWHKFRRKNKWRKLIDETRIRQLKVLAEIGEQAAIDTIEHSITNGYQGLQPERFRGRTQAPIQAKLSFSPSRVHDRDPSWYGERIDDASQTGDAKKPDAELPSRLAEVREQDQQDAI